MRALLLAGALLVACNGRNQTMPNNATPDDATARLKVKLAEAKEQSESYLHGEALPVHDAVVAIVKEERPWWEGLTPEEAFFLFEISPATAARAPVEVRAGAYCAGVKGVNPEWWGTPSWPQSEAAARLVAIGKPVAACLVRLFDDSRRISYHDGESNTEAHDYGWTIADQAAGLTARVLGVPYQADASPEVRAARRQELRSQLK